MTRPKNKGAGGSERPGAGGAVAGRRVLVIDLGGSEGSARRSSAGHLEALATAVAAAPDLARAAAWSGPALAASLFVAARRSTRGDALATPAFVLSVGDAVRRGVPTAARATITARAPLREGLTEAQFGGRFGAAFAGVADALVVVGKASEPVVLAIDGGGSVHALPARSLLGECATACTTGERARALRRPDGRIHVLTTGPAADAGLPFANLAQFDGDDPGGAPSIVGRGGLGASVAAAGVMAITVEDTRPDRDPARDDALHALLMRSPRLLARSAGGTLELGPLREGAVELSGAPREKHGCHGCPTPCGWRFDVNVRGGGARVSGRFSALQGFAGKGDTLALVQRCNDLGIDARSAATLFAESGAGGAATAFLTDLVTEGTAAHRAGARVRSATSHEREPGATFAAADLAARVGQALAARGPEPARSLSVFGLAGIEAADLIEPLEWSGDAELDAGTLAYWHECFAAAVDITGFCAFSAAGLIADGLVDLAELDEILRPRGAAGPGWGIEAAPGAALLAAGAAHVELHREWTGPVAAERAAALAGEMPRAVAAYRRAIGRGFHGAPGDAKAQAPAISTAGARADGPGTVRVSASGVLAARLADHPLRGGARSDEGRVELSLEVDADGLTPSELVAYLAAAHPPAARWLVDASGRPVPAVLVGARRVADGERVVPGQSIEFVLAIPGG